MTLLTPLLQPSPQGNGAPVVPVGQNQTWYGTYRESDNVDTKSKSIANYVLEYDLS